MELNRYVTRLGHQDLEDAIYELNADGYTVMQVLQVTLGTYSIIAAALHLTPAEQEDVIKRLHKAQRAGR